MSSGFFSFMSGGVNRLIEQRKAAELSAYEIAKEERADERVKASEGRLFAERANTVSTAAKLTDQRALTDRTLTNAYNIFKGAYGKTQIKTDPTGIAPPQNIITEPMFKKEQVIASLTSILESMEKNNPVVFGKIQTTLEGYIKLVSDISSVSTTLSVDTTSDPDPEGRTGALTEIQQRVRAAQRGGGIGIGGAALKIPAISLPQQ